MTEGTVFYPLPNVWVREEPTGHLNYAVLDESGVRVINGEVFYMVTGAFLENMLRGLGFEPVEEGK